MKYEVILKKNNYALILRGEKMMEYAVVVGLDEEKRDWDWTRSYHMFYDGMNKTQAQALAAALESFRSATEFGYITRSRMEELATLFKDGIIESDKESAMEYFEDVCDMSEKEMEFFEIETEGENE